MLDLTLCTSNQDKCNEVADILGVPVQAIDLSIPEIQSLSSEEVCRNKVAAAYRLVGKPVLVDDTGLHLDALAGFPGALVTWLLKAGGARALHRLIPEGASLAATAITTIGFADASGSYLFSGEVRGRIVSEPRGENGFGFDTVFVPNGGD